MWDLTKMKAISLLSFFEFGQRGAERHVKKSIWVKKRCEMRWKVGRCLATEQKRVSKVVMKKLVNSGNLRGLDCLMYYSLKTFISCQQTSRINSMLQLRVVLSQKSQQSLTRDSLFLLLSFRPNSRTNSFQKTYFSLMTYESPYHPCKQSTTAETEVLISSSQESTELTIAHWQNSNAKGKNSFCLNCGCDTKSYLYPCSNAMIALASLFCLGPRLSLSKQATAEFKAKRQRDSFKQCLRNSMRWSRSKFSLSTNMRCLPKCLCLNQN